MDHTTIVYILAGVVTLFSLLGGLLAVVLAALVFMLLRFVVKMREGVDLAFAESKKSIEEVHTRHDTVITEINNLTKATEMLANELIVRLPPRPYGVE